MSRERDWERAIGTNLKDVSGRRGERPDRGQWRRTGMPRYLRRSKTHLALAAADRLLSPYPMRQFAAKGHRAFRETGPARSPTTGMARSTAFGIGLHTRDQCGPPNHGEGKARHCARNSCPLERSNSWESVRG